MICMELKGFDILGVVGMGGTGTVYRARQLSPNREVALKTESPEGYVLWRASE